VPLKSRKLLSQRDLEALEAQRDIGAEILQSLGDGDLPLSGHAHGGPLTAAVAGVLASRLRPCQPSCPGSHIRQAAGVAPGSEVSFSLDGGKIVITPLGTGAKGDRRAKLHAAAARVRKSLNPEFRQLGADEIMAFLRGDVPAARRGRG